MDALVCVKDSIGEGSLAGAGQPADAFYSL